MKSSSAQFHKTEDNRKGRSLRLLGIHYINIHTHVCYALDGLSGAAKGRNHNVSNPHIHQAEAQATAHQGITTHHHAIAQATAKQSQIWQKHAIPCEPKSKFAPLPKHKVSNCSHAKSSRWSSKRTRYSNPAGSRQKSANSTGLTTLGETLNWPNQWAQSWH